MNKVTLMGHISSEPQRKELNGKVACLFHLDVTDRSNGRTNIYTHVIILWDKVAEYALLNHGLGSAILVEGKLTSRTANTPAGAVLRVEVVAYACTGMDAVRDKKQPTANPAALQPQPGASASYPAVEQNEARTEAEMSEDEKIEADVAENGLPF